MTPQQEIALREAMMKLAERENRRMRMVCRPAHPTAARRKSAQGFCAARIFVGQIGGGVGLG
ncbi:MAG: hypothetical protein EBT12_02640 [Marivivens sp.]|nr:hypothetical protein [Marivivens sp.]